MDGTKSFTLSWVLFGMLSRFFFFHAEGSELGVGERKGSENCVIVFGMWKKGKLLKLFTNNNNKKIKFDDEVLLHILCEAHPILSRLQLYV